MFWNKIGRIAYHKRMTDDLYLKKTEETVAKLVREGRITQTDAERIVKECKADSEMGEPDSMPGENDCRRQTGNCCGDRFFKKAENRAKEVWQESVGLARDFKNTVSDKIGQSVKSCCVRLSDGVLIFGKKSTIRPYNNYQNRKICLKVVAGGKSREAQFAVSEFDGNSLSESVGQEAEKYVAAAVERQFVGSLRVMKQGFSLYLKIQ